MLIWRPAPRLPELEGSISTTPVPMPSFGLALGKAFTGPVHLGRVCAGAFLVVIGVIRLPTSRLAAYRWFERGVLVSILITQVLIFWQDQLTGLGGLLWDLALLTTLRFLIHQEEARRNL